MISETQQALLNSLGTHLFQKQPSDYRSVDWASLLKEAEMQTVFPIVFSVVEPYLPDELSKTAKTGYFVHLASSMRNAHQHGELHKLLSEHGLPYVIIKGMASASYYPDPFLRSMGDVDFLVPKDKLEETKKLLTGEGYSAKENSRHHSHIAFHRGKEILEMHWEPNGLPEGEKYEICRQYLDDMIERSVLYEIRDERFMIPDPFHHGLILLLHTATHMINTGIGLRHLCDWAVFAGKLKDEEFRALFEEKLKAAGLWRFAQLLTQLATRYLGCPKAVWAEEDDDPDFLEAMIEDIFASGNFGKKDVERINEAKLMTVESTGSVERSNTVVLKVLTEKAYKEMPVCKKVKILLPIGWLYVGIRHMILVIKGKRPKVHLNKMISGAETRREIYTQFQLFR
ncbi:MAG: nucleotidyltransferase family protein [Clostridia bacterium]|nr:nucleotidyltransferase family protein [Clostridia bacterium]